MSCSAPLDPTRVETAAVLTLDRSEVGRWLHAIEPWAYWSGGGILIALFAFFAGTISWAGDFWEHSAVVRELAAHPWAPLHPQFLSHAPHQFYSPYALAVGLMSRWTGLSAITALGLAGVFNAAFLLATFRSFVRALTGEARNATLALLLTLVLWGINPWAWSGFLHWQVIAYVLPYPSAFAAALAFLSATRFVDYVRDARGPALAITVSLATVATLTHPPTAVALAIVLLAIRLGFGPPAPCRADWQLIPAALLALVALTLWPYFPFWDLAFSDSANRREFHAVCLDLYESILPRVLPLLCCGFPCLALLIRRHPRHPIGLALGMLGVVYIAGWFTGLWQLGRMMPWIGLMLHLAMADWLTRQLFGDECDWPRFATRPVVAAALLLMTACCLAIGGIHHRLAELTSRSEPTYAPYAKIGQVLSPSDVVLGDTWSSWVIPTFGGRGIAAQHAQAFVPDHTQRRADLHEFMQPDTSPSRRWEIARAYDADHILLKRDAADVPADLVPQLSAMGESIADAGPLLLIRLQPQAR